jgi:DNA-binding winged helix-turn-helix (wHTH) protein
MLVIDERRPDEIVLDGETVSLQEKQYSMLRILAECPGECVPYDTIYEALWGQRVVESGQMHTQKKNLLNRLRKARPSLPELVKTRPKRGFVLELLPGQVVIRRQGALHPAA